VNRRAALVLSRECGIAGDQIVGKTPQEIGVHPALSLARSGDEMLTLGRSKHKLETVSWGRGALWLIGSRWCYQSGLTPVAKIRTRVASHSQSSEAPLGKAGNDTEAFTSVRMVIPRQRSA